MNKTINETSLANASSLFINTTDYESNSKFQNNFLDYSAQNWLYKEYMRNLIDSINYCFVPLAACIGIFFNFICIVAFSSSRLKSTIYRYLFYNSLFDTITLVIAFVRTFTVYVQVEQVTPYTQFFEPYLFVYFSSVTLTCSNLSKIALAAERICKLKGKLKCFTGKKSFKWIMSSIIAFSIVSNSPILIGYSLFSQSVIKQTIAFVTLNEKGHNSSYAFLFVLNSIFLDIGVFLCVLIIDIILIIVIRSHLKKIAKIESRSAESSNCRSYKRIQFETYEEDLDDDETDEDDGSVVVIANIRNENVSITNRETTTTDSPSSHVEESNANNNIQANSAKKKDEKIVEFSKCNLAKLIQLYCLVFLFGHSLYSFTAVITQIKYFYFYGPLMNLYPKNYYLLNLLIALSYLILYTSFCFNFFVYYKYNPLFRFIIKGRRNKSDEMSNQQTVQKTSDEMEN